MNAMTSPALSAMLATPQIQPVNFLNLLIVDDERSIHEACREIAQSLGFCTYVADSAEQAYRLLDTQARVHPQSGSYPNFPLVVFFRYCAHRNCPLTFRCSFVLRTCGPKKFYGQCVGRIFRTLVMRHARRDSPAQPEESSHAGKD